VTLGGKQNNSTYVCMGGQQQGENVGGKTQLKCTKPLVSPDLSLLPPAPFLFPEDKQLSLLLPPTYVDQKMLQVKLNLLLKPNFT